MGLRYTHKGLVCPVKIKQEQPLGEILISKDVEKIMSFMGLDYSQWESGFGDELESFEWISRSKYFNKEFFKFENLNHQNKTRNRKRAMYSRFVEWLEDKNFKNNYEPANKSEHIWRAALDFGFDWINQAKPLIDDHRRDKEIRLIFSGTDVSRITGLTGAALGDTLKRYKESLGDWKNFFHERTKERMTEHFKEWYSSDKRLQEN